MTPDRLILLPCDIYRGGFSSERVFQIQLPEGEYVGAAPREYFWTADFHHLPPDQPRERDTAVAGFVDARVASEANSQRILVSLPSGDVLEVAPEMMHDHPREPAAHVSVQP